MIEFVNGPKYAPADRILMQNIEGLVLKENVLAGIFYNFPNLKESI